MCFPENSRSLVTPYILSLSAASRAQNSVRTAVEMKISSRVAASITIIPFSLATFGSSEARDSSKSPTSIEVVRAKEIVRTPYAENACNGFHEQERSESGWLLSDCLAVWTAWTNTLEDADFIPCRTREIFNETSSRLRQEGNPCLVQAFEYKDGAGSASIRNLATWMVAEELGCDWVAPQLSSERIDDQGTLMYCHKTVTVKQLRATATSEFDGEIDPANFPDRILRCEVVNWLEFFRFRKHGIIWKNKGTTKSIPV